MTQPPPDTQAVKAFNAKIGVARYVDAGARHLILRIGSLTARPESVAEQLLLALKELGPP